MYKQYLSRRIKKQNNNGQIITLMGIILALSVLVLTSITADLAATDIILSHNQYDTLIDEFLQIKDSFGIALNYNLVILEWDEPNSKLHFHGNIKNITRAFNETKNEYYLLELQHGNLFDAVMQNAWYYYPSEEGPVYQIAIRLSLTDGKSSLSETVRYLLICEQETP